LKRKSLEIALDAHTKGFNVHIIDNDLAKNQPFRIPIDLHLNANNFLPPLHHTLFIVAPDLTPYKCFNIMANRSNQSPPLGRTKTTELSTKGVGKRAKIKVINFLNTCIQNVGLSNLIVDNPFNKHPLCNGSTWQSPINGFTKHKSAREDFAPLIKFLNLRIKKERELIELLQPTFKKETYKIDFTQCHSLPAAIEFQRRNTLKPEKYILSSENEYEKLINSEQNQATLDTVLHDIGDFYLSFFATLDLSIAVMIKKVDHEQKTLCSRLLPWLEAYIKEGANQSFISIFIDSMQEKYAKNGERLTTLKVAEAVFIDQKKDYTGGESLNERQKNILNKWRSGRDIPSAEKLALFVHRLYNITNNEKPIESVEDTDFIVKDVTQLVWSISRLLNLFLEYDSEQNITEDMRKTALCKLLKHYQTHYDHWLNDWVNT
jgi:uncharacterized protein YeeX (DUF496 family)